MGRPTGEGGATKSATPVDLKSAYQEVLLKTKISWGQPGPPGNTGKQEGKTRTANDGEMESNVAHYSREEDILMPKHTPTILPTFVPCTLPSRSAAPSHTPEQAEKGDVRARNRGQTPREQLRPSERPCSGWCPLAPEGCKPPYVEQFLDPLTNKRSSATTKKGNHTSLQCYSPNTGRNKKKGPWTHTHAHAHDINTRCHAHIHVPAHDSSTHTQTHKVKSDMQIRQGPGN